jgi:hypothetical protein
VAPLLVLLNREGERPREEDGALMGLARTLLLLGWRFFAFPVSQGWVAEGGDVLLD